MYIKLHLSEQIYNDFLKEDSRHGSVHQVSHGYLIDLISQVQDMELRFKMISEKATSLDLHLRKVELLMEQLR